MCGLCVLCSVTLFDLTSAAHQHSERDNVNAGGNYKPSTFLKTSTAITFLPSSELLKRHVTTQSKAAQDVPHACRWGTPSCCRHSRHTTVKREKHKRETRTQHKWGPAVAAGRPPLLLLQLQHTGAHNSVNKQLLLLLLLLRLLLLRTSAW